ncbi:MAG: DMT family transporter [Microbacteriaceae bacterium]|nr:DMT family transporter [Microbacteriaceae bacterium]MBT5248445.1 DMT family transporter [Microbacteriaceae bacterium]MBT5730452.1 DMT family transporter [Microbacteriaceae bacterium]
MTNRSRPLSPTYVLAVGASVFAGFFVAVQSRINGEFGLALGNGPLAALLSFSTGFAILGVVLAFRQGARRGIGEVVHALRSRTLPWWGVIGGAGGAFLVLTQGLSAGVLGVALFTIAVVTGQTLGALVIDTQGWFGAVRVRLSLWRVVGALVVLSGVVIALDVGTGLSVGSPLLFILPFLAGMGSGYQQAVNGRVGVIAGSPLGATFVNFGVGTLVLGIVFLVSLAFVELPTLWPTTWWLWIGGAVGTVFIAIQVTTVTIIGVLGLGVSLVTGQLLGSLVLDAYLPVATSHPSVTTIVGALVTLAGSAMVTLTKKA